MRFLSTDRHPNVNEIRRAWRTYVAEDLLPPDAVRPYVRRAWQRSRALGCDAQLARADVLTAASTEALLKTKASLVRTLDPFLAVLSRAAAKDRHAAMLADQHGRLLKIAGDAETVADENFPHPGALLSESTSGANGIGTSLAEDGYVELVGPEHYIEGFHPFTCQGVPVHGPDASTLAILSMSVRRLETADRVRDILFCASEAAECELLSEFLRTSIASEPGPVLERLRHNLIRKLTMARLRLEKAVEDIRPRGGASAIETALELSRRFARQAQMWRDLTGRNHQPCEPERIELGNLVEDFVDLMQPEARLASVQIRWGHAERLAVLESRSGLLARLLSCFLSALQESGPGATLELSVTADGRLGRVALTGPRVTDQAVVRQELAAPLIC